MAEDINDTGWGVDKNMKPCVLPADVQVIFDEAMKAWCGSGFTPVLYLGSGAMVGGTDYYIICRAVWATEIPIEHIVMLTISTRVTNPPTKAWCSSWKGMS